MDAKGDSSSTPPPQLRGGLFQRWKESLVRDDPNHVFNLQPHTDERLVTKAELWGYFTFGLGFNGWAGTTGAILQPILIQQIARSASYLQSDLSVRCPKLQEEVPEGDRCVVPFGFIRVDPTSYTLLISVAAVWCTIFVSLGTSSFADYGRSSRMLMLSFCFIMALSSGLMFLGALEPSIWWVTGLVIIIALMFSGATQNFYDAHIPLLSRHHYSVVQAQLDHGVNSKDHVVARVKMATFLAGGSSAAGYAGGFLTTLIAAVILLTAGQSTLMVGYGVLMNSVFVVLCALIYWKLSFQRTSPSLPAGANPVLFGFQRIGKTISKARSLPTMFFYLICWFFLGDGLTSAQNMAVLIAQAELSLTNSQLIIACLIQFLCAGLALVFWIWVQNSKGVQPKTVVIVNSCLFGLIPVYCLLGFLDGFPLGLKQKWEMYLFAVLFGVFNGAIYSANRVVFSEMIPLGHENELYSLFEMASASSSWIGPLVCTVILENSTIRHTWWFLGASFFIPAFFIFFVNMDKARAEAVDFYEREQAEKKRVQDAAVDHEEDAKVKADIV